MGIGDFFQDIGDALVPESVENWAGGVAGGVSTIAGQLGNVAQGVGWAANPTHWDDIGRGVGNAAEFIAENPGQVWDTAFEVGRYVVKDQLLDPKNLAINLALTGATIATGGGSAGILAARAAQWGRAGNAAFRAAKGAEAGTSMMRAGRLAFQGARAAENAGDVVGAARVGGRLSRFMGKADDVLGKEVEFRQGARSFLSEHTGGLINKQGSVGTRARNWAAEKIAPEGAGLGRQVLAQSVGVNPARPVLSGVSGGSQGLANTAWRARRANMYQGRADVVSEAGHVGRDINQAVNDPLKFAMRKSREHGYEPLDYAAQAGKYLAKKAGAKVMKEMGGGGEKKRPVAATETATTSTGYTAPTLQTGTSTGYGRRSSQARVTGEGLETESSTIEPMYMPRQDAFYGSINQTYAEQTDDLERV